MRAALDVVREAGAARDDDGELQARGRLVPGGVRAARDHARSGLEPERPRPEALRGRRARLRLGREAERRRDGHHAARSRARHHLR